jgi:hypothetical protein
MNSNKQYILSLNLVAQHVHVAERRGRRRRRRRSSLIITRTT